MDFDAAVRIGGTARVWVVAEAVLGAKLPVDLVEDAVEFGGLIRKKHGSAGHVSDGLQSVLASGIPAAFVFDRAKEHGVEKRAGFHSLIASGVEVGVAGGFSAVGNQQNDPAPIIALTLKRT
jgi:hypothetical protein